MHETASLQPSAELSLGKCSKEGGQTHIIDKRNALDVQVFTIECVLQQLHDIVSNGILCRKPLGPREDLPLIQGGLLDWETERKTQRQRWISVWVDLIDC